MVFGTYMDKLKSVETHNYTQFDERASKHCADIILKAKEVKVATDDESINQGWATLEGPVRGVGSEPTLLFATGGKERSQARHQFAILTLRRWKSVLYNNLPCLIGQPGYLR
jgi:hypothetical protein